MDIGAPYRDLGPIDVQSAVAHIESLPDEAWTQNPFRQEILAAGVHSVTRAILFKHEWRRWENTWGVNTIQELAQKWAARKGIDPTPFLPVASQETDEGPVHTFADWDRHKAVLQPVVDRAIDYLRTKTGIVTRLALVWLHPGKFIKLHTDDQHMAHKAHRLHIPLLAPPGVEYKVGDETFGMKVGRVYDFNNRWPHSVRHQGNLPRVNFFIDYYAKPGLYIPPPYGHF